MPQMSPLMWLLLFLFFSALLMTSILKNYFNYLIDPPLYTNLDNPLSSPNLNWKW